MSGRGFNLDTLRSDIESSNRTSAGDIDTGPDLKKREEARVLALLLSEIANIFRSYPEEEAIRKLALLEERAYLSPTPVYVASKEEIDAFVEEFNRVLGADEYGMAYPMHRVVHS